MFKDMLNLKNAVVVSKVTKTSNGMGGFTEATTTTTLRLAAIWQVGSANKYISNKTAKDSTHVLAIEYGAYTFNTAATATAAIVETVIYNGATYRLTGFADDVMNLNEILVQGMERML